MINPIVKLEIKKHLRFNLKSYLLILITFLGYLILLNFLIYASLIFYQYFNQWQEDLTIDLFLKKEITEPQQIEIVNFLQKNEFVKSMKYFHPDLAAQKLEKILDIQIDDLFDTNPLPASIQVELKFNFFNLHHISDFFDQLNKFQGLTKENQEFSFFTTWHKNFYLIMVVMIALVFFIVLIFLLSLFALFYYLLEQNKRNLKLFRIYSFTPSTIYSSFHWELIMISFISWITIQLLFFILPIINLKISYTIQTILLIQILSTLLSFYPLRKAIKKSKNE